MSSSILADPTYTAVKAVIAGIENKATTLCGFEPHLPFDIDPCRQAIEVFFVVLGLVRGWVLADV